MPVNMDVLETKSFYSSGRLTSPTRFAGIFDIDTRGHSMQYTMAKIALFVIKVGICIYIVIFLRA